MFLISLKPDAWKLMTIENVRALKMKNKVSFSVKNTIKTMYILYMADSSTHLVLLTHHHNTCA